MAHPVVAGVTEGSVNTAGTSHAITLPSSGAASDEWIIIMDIGSTAATMNALTDWTEILDENVANGLKIWVYDGSGVPSNPTFTSSANTRSAWIAYRITGADKAITPEIGTTATGSSATPDPPPAAFTADKDYLFIVFAGMAGEEADDDTWGNTSPTNYTPSPPRQKACGIAGTNLGGKILSAERQLTPGFAEDPGTFGVDVSAAWRAQTITVHPATILTPARLDHTRSVLAPTVSPQLRPDRLDHTRQVLAPVVSPQLRPDRLDHTRDIFTPTVSLGTTLTPDRLDHTRQVLAPTLNSGLVMARLDHTRQVLAPTTQTFLMPARLDHTRELYVPTIPGAEGGGEDDFVARKKRIRRYT